MASSASESAADLCILGSGVAGMLLAERAIRQGRRVLMIERGTAMTHSQRLRQESHDDPLPFNKSPLRIPHEPPPRGPRTRWDRDYPYWPVNNLGGTTNSFFGNMPRWHPSHFDQEAFAGGISRRWPVRYADLEPYYLQAEQRLAISGNSVDVPFAGRFDYPLPPHRLSPSDRACASIFGKETVLQIPTTRLSRTTGGLPQCCGTNKCDLCPTDSKGNALNTLYPAIRSRIELRTGLLATTIHASGGRARAVTALDAEGKPHRIEAREFVVACGGVDSVLLLQRSPDVPHLPSLGRYYMDHPIIELAIYDSGVDARPGYGDSAQVAMFLPFFERISDDLPLSMLGEIRCGSLSEPGGLMRDILMRDILGYAVDASRDGSSFRQHFERIFRSTIDIWFTIEPQPLASQTVSIDRIEPNGQPVPKIQLRYPTYFGQCLDLLVAYVRARLPRAHVAHVGTMATGYHWMGATRMSTSAADGVVDPDLRHHELENLYVLSTSVFCSASSANPTMTLAALALRLADHMETRRRT
jgi:choline dehydrogenase-like flavoprotein